MKTKAQLKYAAHLKTHDDEGDYENQPHSHPVSATGQVFGVNPKGFCNGKENAGFYVNTEEHVIYVWQENHNDEDNWSFWHPQCGNVTPDVLMEWANVLLLAAEHMLEVDHDKSI